MISFITRLITSENLVTRLIASAALVSALSAPPTYTTYCNNLINASTIPAHAIYDEDNSPLLDESGGYIEGEY